MINYINPEEVKGGNNWNNNFLTEKYNKDSSYLDNDRYFKIFLAGTIDNGECEDWQYDLYCKLFMRIEPIVISTGEVYCNRKEYDINLYSPRRNNWNPESTIEDIENQIKWEQDKLDKADLIVMVLQDNSKSPISLLELGLYGPSGKLICFCTKNFYRYNNVKLTCEKYNIPLKETTDSYEIVGEIEKILQEIY